MSARGVNISPGTWWRAALGGVCRDFPAPNIVFFVLFFFFLQTVVLQRCNLLFLSHLAVAAEVQLGTRCLWLDGFRGTEVPV